MISIATHCLDSTDAKVKCQRKGKLGTTILVACLLTLSGLREAHSAEAFSDPGFASELVTTLPAFAPVGIAWAPDGRMFIWQKNGIVRVFHDGDLHATPF